MGITLGCHGDSLYLPALFTLGTKGKKNLTKSVTRILVGRDCSNPEGRAPPEPSLKGQCPAQLQPGLCDTPKACQPPSPGVHLQQKNTSHRAGVQLEGKIDKIRKERRCVLDTDPPSTAFGPRTNKSSGSDLHNQHFASAAVLGSITSFKMCSRSSHDAVPRDGDSVLPSAAGDRVTVHALKRQPQPQFESVHFQLPAPVSSS